MPTGSISRGSDSAGPSVRPVVAAELQPLSTTAADTEQHNAKMTDPVAGEKQPRSLDTGAIKSRIINVGDSTDNL